MPFTGKWPFERVQVDHLFYGTTRVWWSLVAGFTDPTPWTFQLQAGYTGVQDALDWVNVGAPAQNVWYLEHDSDRERTGKLLLTHYRVLMTTPQATFASAPAPIWGVLEKHDWLKAQEIARKQRLEFELAGVRMYLVKRFRRGLLNDQAVDFLTNEVVDSGHPKSWGTPFKVGYHPPQLVELTSELRNWEETRGGGDPSTYSGLQVSIAPTMLSAPWLSKEDILIDERTDQRWVVDGVKEVAGWRGVPILIKPTLSLLPHDHPIYRYPVGPESTDPNDEYQEPLPSTGTGCVEVDHDYPTDDNLAYQTTGCCGIEGATVLAFRRADWDNGLRTAAHAVASSQTGAMGRWLWAMMLDPGDYVIVFEKPGEYGPNAIALTVTAPAGTPASSSSSVSTASSSFGEF